MKSSEFMNKMLDLYIPILEHNLPTEEFEELSNNGYIEPLVKKMSKVFSRNNRNSYSQNFNMKYTRVFSSRENLQKYIDSLHSNLPALFKEFNFEVGDGKIIYVLFGIEA